MIIDIAAGHISMKHKLGGPNFAVVSACASSTNGMIDAYNYIRLGMADGIVTGGSEAAVIEAGIGGFAAMKALSTRNDDPKTASRPFDLDRDGFVMGEGGGGLVLEEMEHAQKRGAKIYAEIVGGGMSADAHHMTAPHPEGEGAAGAIEAIACIKAIQTGIVPPTINHFTDDENLDSKLNLTFNTAQEREINAALSNTFGFGGHNASVIFKKFEN